jgi:hypothetical protein
MVKFEAVGKESAFQQQIVVNQAMLRFQDLEERLVASSNRIQFLSAVIMQKEISYRNSYAALQADRQLMAMAMNGHPVATESDLAAAAGGEAMISTSHLQLRPEAEALLLGLFSYLDPCDLGQVHVDLLIKALTASGESDSSDASLGDLLRQEIGSGMYKQLMDRMRALVQATVTWGEFLMLLLPSSSTASAAATVAYPTSSPLTTMEMKDLCQEKVLDDMAWGFIPLQLPSSMPIASSNNQEQLHPETARLLQERAYLLQKLQESSKSMQRRAEAIRGYFASKLKKQELHEKRLQHQAEDQQQHLQQLQQRIDELIALRDSDAKYHSQRVAVLEAEVEDLRGRLELRVSADIARYEDLLADQQSKCLKLQSEYQLLQREASRQEVRGKGWQRDLMRMQASYLTASEDKERLMHELEDLQRQHHHLEDAFNQLKHEDEDRRMLQQSEKSSESMMRDLLMRCEEQLRDRDEEIDRLKAELEQLRSNPSPFPATAMINPLPMTIARLPAPRLPSYDPPMNLMSTETQPAATDGASLNAMQQHLKRLLRLAEQIVIHDNQQQPSASAPHLVDKVS